MKLFLLAIAVTIISVQAELSEKEKQKAGIISKECQKESGLSDETIRKARQGDFEETPAMKKHLLCFAEKHDLINKDGDINHKNLKERVKKILGDDKAADNVIEKCAKKKDSAEETAFHLFKCFFETTNIKLK